MTSVKGTHSGRGPAVVVALVGGELSSNKPLFDVVLNSDGWAIESGQSPDYELGSHFGPEVPFEDIAAISSNPVSGHLSSSRQFGKKTECITFGSKLEEFMIRRERRDEALYKGKDAPRVGLESTLLCRPIHRNKSEYRGSERRGAHFALTVSQGR
jgi:hypothetical protein